mgnify:FL=1
MSLCPRTLTILRITKAPDGKGRFVESQTTIALTGAQGGTVQPATTQNGGQFILSMESGRRDQGHVVIYTKSTLVAPQEGAVGVSPDRVVWRGGIWEVVHQEPHDGILIRHNKYIAEYRGASV